MPANLRPVSSVTYVIRRCIYLSLVIIFLVASAGLPRPVSAQSGTATPTLIPVTNLLTNGGFESGTLTGWDDNGGITVASTAGYAGSWGAKMATDGRIDQSFATVSGQTYNDLDC